MNTVKIIINIKLKFHLEFWIKILFFSSKNPNYNNKIWNLTRSDPIGKVVEKITPRPTERKKKTYPKHQVQCQSQVERQCTEHVSLEEAVSMLFLSVTTSRRIWFRLPAEIPVLLLHHLPLLLPSSSCSLQPWTTCAEANHTDPPLPSNYHLQHQQQRWELLVNG